MLFSGVAHKSAVAANVQCLESQPLQTAFANDVYVKIATMIIN